MHEGRRRLQFDGCANTRDLGGLALTGGGVTRFGSVVRSDHPRKLSAAGWDQLLEYGVRTVVSLVSDGAPWEDQGSGWPSEIERVVVAIEDLGERDFLESYGRSGLLGTPFYYPEALRRWPGRQADAIRAITAARSGGVLFHCQRGRDRTGIISLLLLGLCGVEETHIIADYELSDEALSDDESAELAEVLAREERKVADGLRDVLAALDAATYLADAGLTQAELTAARGRLVAGAERVSPWEG